jgi:hypothetical protein
MSFSKIFQDKIRYKEPHTNRTICELHRELYDLYVINLYKKNPVLMKKMILILENAYIHGVKMNRKLCKYKLGSSSKWSKKEYRNKEVSRKEVVKLRKERVKIELMIRKNEKILKKFNEEYNK